MLPCSRAPVLPCSRLLGALREYYLERRMLDHLGRQSGSRTSATDLARCPPEDLEEPDDEPGHDEEETSKHKKTRH